MRSRSVAFVTPGFPPRLGGVETHVAELAVRAARSGWRVDIISQDRNEQPSVETVEGVTVRRFPNRAGSRTFPFAPGLFRYLAQHAHDYDVVHAHNYHSLPALAAARAQPQQLVFTPHYLGVRETVPGRLLHRLYQRPGASIFRRATRVICVTASEAAVVQSDFAVPSHALSVIPNGIDVEGLRTASPVEVAGPVILAAGRLESYKNVHRIIRAVPHLDASYNLYIAGGGPARPHLQGLVGQLGISGRVHFLGNLDHATLDRWYRTAAVYVSMSTRECFGITVREALVAGAGVVAADTPVHREVLSGAASGQAALVSAAADDATLADSIRSVRAPPARFRASEAPSWDGVAHATLALYGSVLTSRSRAER